MQVFFSNKEMLGGRKRPKASLEGRQRPAAVLGEGGGPRPCRRLGPRPWEGEAGRGRRLRPIAMLREGKWPKAVLGGGWAEAPSVAAAHGHGGKGGAAQGREWGGRRKAMARAASRKKNGPRPRRGRGEKGAKPTVSKINRPPEALRRAK